MSFIIEKRCLECGTPFRGRPDKKFCTDQCRTTFHNRLNREEVNLIRNINYALRKNRRILADLNASGKSRVRTETLQEKGFDFDHFTSVYKGHNGQQHFYCYDQGYTRIGPEWYLLVTRKAFYS
jgi:hypothetical protein